MSRNRNVNKHTPITAQEAIDAKGINFLKVTNVTEDGYVEVEDIEHGVYFISTKDLSPCMDVPLTKNRKLYNKLKKIQEEMTGKEVKGRKIIRIFYGPFEGYKNNGFVCEFQENCGHICYSTLSLLKKHRITNNCKICSKTSHGFRVKDENGIRIPRTQEYTSWLRLKSKLLPQYGEDFMTFKLKVGDKPSKKAKVEIIQGHPCWIDYSLSLEGEMYLIGTAVRQAFKNSGYYKNALEKARVETSYGPRYKCAACGHLFKRSEIEVDHIDPVVNVDGSPLTRENIITRIWTDKLQILDISCHLSKSTSENKQRRTNKKDSK